MAYTTQGYPSPAQGIASAMPSAGQVAGTGASLAPRDLFTRLWQRHQGTAGGHTGRDPLATSGALEAWRAKQNPNLGQGLPGMNAGLSQMNPYDEAQRSAQLLYDMQARAQGDYQAQQNAQLSRALTEGYGAVNQQMADQGILSSTGAAGALGRAYTQIADPYQQRITQSQEGLRQYGGQLGEQTALMFQQLLRDARGEARTDRTYEQQKTQWQAEFDEAVRRGDREAAQNAYNMLSSIALSRAALADNPTAAYRAPVQPSYMTSLFTNQFLAPQAGTGPTGDAPMRRPGEAVPHYNPLEGVKSAREGDKEQAAIDRAHALAYARASKGGSGGSGAQEKGDPWEALTATYLSDPSAFTADQWLGVAGSGFGLDPVGLASAGNPRAAAFLKLIGYGGEAPVQRTALSGLLPRGGNERPTVDSPAALLRSPAAESNAPPAWMKSVLNFFDRGFNNY